MIGLRYVWENPDTPHWLGKETAAALPKDSPAGFPAIVELVRYLLTSAVLGASAK